jgi:hypothetical protein
LFGEGGVFPEGAVDGAAEAGGEGFGVEGAGDVTLVEEGDDLVLWESVSRNIVVWGGGGRTSGLETCDALSYRLDDAGAVGAGDHGRLHGEGVFALGNDEVAVIEGGGVDYRFVSNAL